MEDIFKYEDNLNMEMLLINGDDHLKEDKIKKKCIPKNSKKEKNTNCANSLSKLKTQGKFKNSIERKCFLFMRKG